MHKVLEESEQIIGMVNLIFKVIPTLKVPDHSLWFIGEYV